MSGDWTCSFGFASKHARRCNFSYADGRITFVAETVNMDVYRAAGTIDVNEPSSLP
jgi:prepilin-type processing-associated H-X9-DG protein